METTVLFGVQLYGCSPDSCDSFTFFCVVFGQRIFRGRQSCRKALKRQLLCGLVLKSDVGSYMGSFRNPGVPGGTFYWVVPEYSGGWIFW